MPSFPFTFPYAGRTFSVVSDGLPAREERLTAPRPVAPAEEGSDGVYVRIIGIRGLHEFGRVDPRESNGGLQARICRWYDETYTELGAPAGRRSLRLLRASAVGTREGSR